MSTTGEQPADAAISLPTLDSALLGTALPIVQQVMSNEETRFGNLNTRGAAVLSATALVTGLAGFFSKELLSTTNSLGGAKGWVGASLFITVIFLAATAIVVVWKVLLPSKRALVGNNPLFPDPAGDEDPPEPAQYSEPGSDNDVRRIALNEYYLVASSLRLRNRGKAAGLNLSYILLCLAIVFSSLGAISVCLVAAGVL